MSGHYIYLRVCIIVKTSKTYTMYVPLGLPALLRVLQCFMLQGVLASKIINAPCFSLFGQWFIIMARAIVTQHVNHSLLCLIPHMLHVQASGTFHKNVLQPSLVGKHSTLKWTYCSVVKFRNYSN